MDAPLEVLSDPAYEVPPVAAGSHGVAWLRSRVARFSRGDDHARRRELAIGLLADLHWSVTRPASPVEVLAGALGLPAGVAGDVALIAACYQPHLPVDPRADEAVERLIVLCGGERTELTAARIGLLVQACDPTAALVRNLRTGGTEPPVPLTRRVAPDGTLVEVDLAGAPFGRGPHACPAREVALAVAAALA